MKKERFLDLVCESLDRLGATEEEIVKQRIHINAYLEDLGIEEESEELDYENPHEFAETIFRVIEAKRPRASVSEEDEEDVRVYEEDKSSLENDISEPDETADEDEVLTDSEEFYDDEPEEGATREFSISELPIDEETKEEEEDYYEEDELPTPTGNPIFFWMITVILAPLWIPLAATAGVLTILGYVLLAAFVVLYVPILVALILGGSVSILAELVYSIVKFVTGEAHIGLFEIGLGFIISALTISLSVLIYRYGTKYSKRHFRNYWRGVRRLIKRIKKAVWKLREVCSI